MIEIKCETIEELRQILNMFPQAPVLPCITADQEVTKMEQEVPKAEQKVLETDQEVTKTDQEVPAASHSLADVRAVLAQVQKTKGKDVLKALLEEFGVKAVSKVPEDKIDELYEKAVALNA